MEGLRLLSTDDTRTLQIHMEGRFEIRVVLLGHDRDQRSFCSHTLSIVPTNQACSIRVCHELNAFLGYSNVFSHVRSGVDFRHSCL
jgi:hypothetical protein